MNVARTFTSQSRLYQCMVICWDRMRRRFCLRADSRALISALEMKRYAFVIVTAITLGTLYRIVSIKYNFDNFIIVSVLYINCLVKKGTFNR